MAPQSFYEHFQPRVGDSIFRKSEVCNNVLCAWDPAKIVSISGDYATLEDGSVVDVKLKPFTIHVDYSL